MIPSLQQQYALAHCMLYGEPKPAIPENLLRYFGPRQFPGTTSIGYRQTHPEIFQDTLDTPLETFDVWLERAVMRTASAIAKAETGCQRRSPAKTTPLPQMVEQVAGILSFETKGCRNFEMLRGQLPVPWYASFNCNRALSIRTVGVDGPPVFLRIPSGLNAYDGFTQPRMGPSPSYPNSGVRFARMTTTDLLAALNRSLYHDMRERIGDDFELNTALTNVSQEKGVTVAEMIDRLANREDAQTIFLSAKDKLVPEKGSFAI